ncbi:hypothetical protein [Microbacterium sediminicola]|uniref:hypothetical protein n=1 Tax=Microbacterium sediminicola TaxID=415210 RepID=UPI0031D34628
MALSTDGSYGLLDVRPADLIDDAARVQFGETAAVRDALGWRYRVLPGHDKRATGNLDSLSASRHDRCRTGHKTETLRRGGNTSTRRRRKRLAGHLGARAHWLRWHGPSTVEHAASPHRRGLAG